MVTETLSNLCEIHCKVSKFVATFQYDTCVIASLDYDYLTDWCKAIFKGYADLSQQSVLVSWYSPTIIYKFGWIWLSGTSLGLTSICHNADTWVYIKICIKISLLNLMSSDVLLENTSKINLFEYRSHKPSIHFPPSFISDPLLAWHSSWTNLSKNWPTHWRPAISLPGWPWNDLIQGYTKAPSIIWWCHNIKMLSTLLALCEGNPPVTGGFPSQRTSNEGIDIFFTVSQNKLLNKQ